MHNSGIESCTFFFSCELLLINHCTLLYLLLGSLVQSLNRMANSFLTLNKEMDMDAVTVCSGLLVTVHKKGIRYV